MPLQLETFPIGKRRLALLLDHVAPVEDPRDGRRIPHPLPEILFLVVCGTSHDRGAGAAPLHPVSAFATTARHFALDLVRTAADKRSIRSRRKLAGWTPNHLNAILSSQPAQFGFGVLGFTGRRGGGSLPAE